MKLMHGVKLGFSFSLMLVVSACATLTDESMSGKPAVANNGGVTVGRATNAPTNGGTIAPSYSNTGINKSANSASQSDVIRSLLSTAKKQRDNKQYANATATLDRAVRIAPKEPEPFKQLAEVRFEQFRIRTKRVSKSRDSFRKLHLLRWCSKLGRLYCLIQRSAWPGMLSAMGEPPLAPATEMNAATAAATPGSRASATCRSGAPLL